MDWSPFGYRTDGYLHEFLTYYLVGAGLKEPEWWEHGHGREEADKPGRLYAVLAIQLIRRLADKYLICEKCGEFCLPKTGQGRSHKYCPDCREDAYKQKDAAQKREARSIQRLGLT